MDARRQEVTYWLSLVLIAVGIVGVILFLFRDRFASRRMEQKEVQSQPLALEAAPPKPTVTPMTAPSGEEVAAATATTTPQATSTPRVQPTNTPDRAALRRDLTQLRQVASTWIYRGYAQMGPRKIGRFGYTKRQGQTFTAEEGEVLEGVTIERLDRTKALLSRGEATFELLIKPEEVKPPPAPPARPRTRRPPERPDRRPLRPGSEESGKLSEQETPFEP